MKKLLIFIFCLLFAFPFSVFAAAEDEEAVKTANGYYDIEAPGYTTEIALLVNADTDTVVYSKNADKVTAPASLVKIVTAMVALEKSNNNLQTVITCSEKAITSLNGTGSSTVGLKVGEKMTLEMLLYCMFLSSANDAAAVIADYFGKGNQASFVAEMNKYVTDLGCKNTYFANPHGLDDEKVKGYEAKTQNKTTANDMYLIAKAAIANENIVKISSKYGKTIPKTNSHDERNIYNSNPLLNNYSYYYYEGAIGLKNAYTSKAGCCLISAATKDGYTYISIAMRGNNNYVDGGEKRNTAYLMCRYMLKWAFSNIKMKVLADSSYNVGEIPVKYGRGVDYVALVPKDDITAIVHEDLDIEAVTIEYAADFPEKIKAPVKQGEEIGKATVIYKGVKIADVTLVAQQDVKKNYLWAMFSWLEKLMSSKVFIVIVILVVIAIVVLLLSTQKQRKRKKRLKNRIDIVKDYSKLSK